MPVTVEGEQPTCLIEFDMMADSGEQILNLAVVVCGVADAVGSNERQAERVCDTNCRLIAPLLLALMVPLQLDENVLLSEDADELFDGRAACRFAAACERRGQGTLVSAGQAD